MKVKPKRDQRKSKKEKSSCLCAEEGAVIHKSTLRALTPVQSPNATNQQDIWLTMGGKRNHSK